MSDEVKTATATTELAAVKMKPCSMCGLEILHTARRCEHCESLQYTTQCIVCKEYIPLTADYCNHCKSWQDKRRHFGMSQSMLALIVALIAVLSPLLKAISEFATRHSKTTTAYQSCTADEIIVTAMNTGRSPSLLRRYRLKPSHPGVLDPAELQMSFDPKADSKLPGNVVPANGALTFRLKVTGLASRLSPEDLRDALEELQMTLEIDVLESDDAESTRRESVPAKTMELFILANLPSEPSKEQEL